MIITTKYKTPLGDMIIGAKDDGICLFDFEYRKMMPSIKKRISTFLNDDFQEGEHELFSVVKLQYEEYLKGERETFDLPLVMTGTDFQKSVWTALQDIPFGKTRTYKEQSVFLGDEKAIRAVARANGENCLAVIIPCHRVIGSDGSLTGYAGGIRAKKWLLEHEKKVSGVSYQQTIF